MNEFTFLWAWFVIIVFVSLWVVGYYGEPKDRFGYPQMTPTSPEFEFNSVTFVVSSLHEIRSWVEQCQCLDLIFIVDLDQDRPYFQIHGTVKDSISGNSVSHSGRKWFLSYHMTKSEVVQTVLKASLTWAEHEIREHFKFRGVSIFDPHYDVEKLVELRNQANSLDVRK